MDFEKILDENGTLMEKIPKINKNGPASSTTKETGKIIILKHDLKKVFKMKK